ncbi:DUF4352 domain-containing protein [Lihuaxuella thermophila]|uniref:DUF4352 domain-containing protein n=1 Tax=Lihuaxuella thermophila TaxID=1173111 RepID=A0A1H8IR02_9BACL|nr:DUF4352 domain-containing protein [Lihuaxuella thermophila]SEN70108.1 protein of unknown function [Lihuaxuella thermophila]
MKSKLLLVTLISIFTLTGCTISIGQPAPASNDANTQNAANNQNTSAANNQNAQNAANNQNATNQSQGSSDVGQTKTVGDLTVTVNAVREVSGNDTSQPKNGKYIVIDASITNNGDQTRAVYADDATLTDANGLKAEAQYSPYGITELNYVTTTLPGHSKVPRGVLVFDTSGSGPYTLTITQNGSSATWKIQP